MGRKRMPVFLLFFAFTLSIAPLPSPAAGWSAIDATNLGAPHLGPVRSEATPQEGFKALFVNDRMAGLDTFIIYLLQANELMQTKFLFPQKHYRSQVFLDDFTRVEEVLREKYGQPTQAGEFWRVGNLAEMTDMARMVAVGELTLKSEWETEDLLIVHTLRGENLDIDHEVNYISKRITRSAAEIMQTLRPPQFF